MITNINSLNVLSMAYLRLFSVFINELTTEKLFKIDQEIKQLFNIYLCNSLLNTLYQPSLAGAPGNTRRSERLAFVRFASWIQIKIKVGCIAPRFSPDRCSASIIRLMFAGNVALLGFIVKHFYIHHDLLARLKLVDV